ncbi:hypothetical protein P22_2092 [Propionispora sp. 2/2-37]|uniref:DUF2971 domain-containing protein n=1 Tax=Propionispora sp. 2/2-37 TaxID=1677858 RepID=UPI0006BB82A0|nr:DUF2971 domain-containing protein [Propionispora sp. 2/2-37]CUH96004.1 hypothetical protein P22_2092 [Propionispora sp. 2/2-37]
MQNDKFEGSLSEVNMLQRKYMPYGFEEEETPEFYANLKKLFLISCWHRSSIESYAMWKIYSNDAQGVAIETTIDNLHDSFICNDEHLRKTPSDKWGKEEMLTHEIIPGNVIYYDGRYKDIPDGYPYKFRRFFYKQKFFEYEKEHRLIINGERIWLMVKNDPQNDYITEYGFMNNGESLSVDVKKLINKVIVCPNAHPWFIKLVIDIVKKYGLDEKIVQESMMSKAPYS